MGQQGFGSLTPDVILARLMHLYGKPSIPELNQALSRLQEPMDRAASIAVMLCNIKEVQMFLLVNPDEDCQQKETQLITYALIRVTNTGLYNKAIERWNSRDVAGRKT